MKTFRQLLYFLTSQEKKRAGLLLIMILLMAFIDTLGVASIFPFIALLTNPSLVETNFFLNSIFQASNVIGIKTNQEFIFLFGVLVFMFLIFSLSFKAITIYVQTRFIEMRGYSIGKNLLENYLNQPYSWFLNRNSADFAKTILSEVGLILAQGLTPIFNLISYSIVSISIILLLLLINIKLTLIAAFVIGGAYLIIFYFSRKFLFRIGEERVIANKFRFKWISEAFGALKVVKVSRVEKVFIDRFSESSITFAKHQASSQIINQLPRFLIEAISFGGMIIIILFSITKTGSFINSAPIIAVYAFASYRLLPSIQQIYQASTSLKFSNATINNLYNDLKNLEAPVINQDQGILHFNKSITLNHIYYNYPNSLKTALKDISIKISVGSTVGLIGPTGCGKTTTVDIILGLLEPQKGTLEIDGEVIISKNIRAWQRSIGFVPQHIYLSDDTIAANIAFGVNPKDIDQKAVEKACKIANIHNFIINELPKQYQTTTGERGIRLSGGQLQRIGIARALYHNPKVLILDEATSALDNQTEKVVMDAINNLNKEITIILIAHRLNTVKNCDIIFKLDKGELVSQGTYEELNIDNKL